MDSNYIITSDGSFVNANELYHWGIKGMKWGIRRYQNKDGTLTSAGKKRRKASYADEIKEMSTDELRRKVNRMNNEQRYIDLTKSSSSRISKTADSVERATRSAGDINKIYKATKGDNNPNSKIAGQGIDAAARTARLAKKIDSTSRDARDATKAKKKLEKMDDNELARQVDRLNLEQQYSRLRDADVRRGKVRASDVLDIAGDVLAIGASAVTIAVGIKKLMPKKEPWEQLNFWD